MPLSPILEWMYLCLSSFLVFWRLAQMPLGGNILQIKQQMNMQHIMVDNPRQLDITQVLHGPSYTKWSHTRTHIGLWQTAFHCVSQNCQMLTYTPVVLLAELTLLILKRVGGTLLQPLFSLTQAQPGAIKAWMISSCPCTPTQIKVMSLPNLCSYSCKMNLFMGE